MKKLLSRIIKFKKKYDIRFFVYEKYSRKIGQLSIFINKILYGEKLKIESPYNIWGSIRILIHGTGSIKIGKNLYAVSDRRRSSITLFSPCHLNVLGEGKIILNEHVGLNGTTIVSREKIEIGDNTMIAPNTIIIDFDGHDLWPPDLRWKTKGNKAPIKIGKNVWIGMNCVILKGVTVGDGTVIATGSVVIDNCESNSLYAGNPAKKIKKFD